MTLPSFSGSSITSTDDRRIAAIRAGASRSNTIEASRAIAAKASDPFFGGEARNPDSARHPSCVTCHGSERPAITDATATSGSGGILGGTALGDQGAKANGSMAVIEELSPDSRHPDDGNGRAVVRAPLAAPRATPPGASRGAHST